MASRKLSLVPVMILACLLLSNVVWASGYKEAPELAALVAEGKLPPVDQRLPLEPFVLKGQSVGKYGGNLKGMSIAPETWDDLQTGMIEGFTIVSNDGSTLVPNVAKGWEFSEDNAVLTVSLREGMKWSDGHPFTADDILYWWEDMMLNEEITPTLSKWWCPSGEPMGVTKIDDYTVKFDFGVSYPGAPMLFATAAPNPITMPRHYLQQFHIKYNPDAQKLAEENGYAFWYQYHGFHATELPTQKVLNRPTLQPWVLVAADSINKRFERNPYYWKVDTAGNQLPYIDHVRIEYVGNLEVANLKALSGEVDVAGMEVLMENIPLLKRNETVSKYTVHIARSTKGSDVSLTFNLNHPDPVLNEIFNDVRFRQAMSLGINRNEINQLLFFGYATPRQATVHPLNSYFKQEWADAYAEFDPERANQLLDEMGLDKRNAEGYRLRPDGQVLTLQLDFLPHEGPKTSTVELVSTYWGNLGIMVSSRARERSYILERVNNSQHDVTAWHIDRSMELPIIVYEGNKFGPPGDSANIFAKKWGDWLTSDGRIGEEPPQKMKDLFDALVKLKAVDQSSPEYLELVNRAFDIQAEQLYLIGTVGIGGWPLVVQNRLKNVIDPNWDTIWFGADNWFWRTMEPAKWYFE